MQSKAATVEEYLADLPEDRRAAIQAVRRVILENIPEGVEEGMAYGMIGYFVPHSIYPKGYHCDPRLPLTYCALASQKNHMSVYLCGIYSCDGPAQWFVDAYKASGRRVDMGKSCVRFKKLEDLPLELVAEAIRRQPLDRFIAEYEAALAAPRERKR